MKHPKWTQARVSEGKSVASTRILALVQMTTKQLADEYHYCFVGRPSETAQRETLLRYLVLEALDRAFPDSLTQPKDPSNVSK
jgi:hypothetical protein